MLVSSHDCAVFLLSLRNAYSGFCRLLGRARFYNKVIEHGQMVASYLRTMTLALKCVVQ